MAILAEGRLLNVENPIFDTEPAFPTSVLSFTKINIEKITIFNPSSTPQTVKIFVQRQDSDFRQVRQFVLEENQNGEYLDPGDRLPLLVGDTINGLATDSDIVEFVVYGELV